MRSIPLSFIMRTLSVTGLFLLCLMFANSRASECPPMQMHEMNSHYSLVSQLTHPCRYDTTVRPEVLHSGPLVVRARMYVYYLQMTHSTNLVVLKFVGENGSTKSRFTFQSTSIGGVVVEFNKQFKVQMLIQYRWQDGRLSYVNVSSVPELIGHKMVLERLWFPHIFVANDHESSVRGLTSSDQIVTITPQGQVFFSTRLHTRLICQAEEGKFPFDHQTCHLVMDNWRYNLSYVVLRWEDHEPLVLPSGVSSLTEFDFIRHDTTTSDQLKEIGDTLIFSTDKRKSSLIVNFHFARKFSFYFWDYYLPSVILIVTSWGTFWVDPEIVPARVWLATCTLLGFFGLGAMNDAMPKLSHLKMNDIWFIGCNLFIILSLAEFAFVNVVHRQETKHIPLKRASSKYILKSSLRSEKVTWKRKASSCPASPELKEQREKGPMAERRQQQKSVVFDLVPGDVTNDTRWKRQLSRRRQAFSGTHMTNHEMANWIDQRSRVLFPLAFLVFNMLFWFVMFI